MPALKNPRHETFAQALARGTNPAVAYGLAGYRAQGRAAQAGASRLAADSAIARRVTELAAKIAPVEPAAETIACAESNVTESSAIEMPAAETSAAQAAPRGANITEVTVGAIIRELEDARQLAMAKMQPAPAVSATLGKAKIAGLIVEKAENRSEATVTFVGTDTEAARRIAFVLCLAAIEPSGDNQT